ncbi:hypothetical protein ACNHUS_34700 [Actinomycetes bacterium M1A6_2h]
MPTTGGGAVGDPPAIALINPRRQPLYVGIDLGARMALGVEIEGK